MPEQTLTDAVFQVPAGTPEGSITVRPEDIQKLSLSNAFVGGKLKPVEPTRSLDEIRSDLKAIGDKILRHWNMGLYKSDFFQMPQNPTANEKLDDLATRTRVRIAEIGQNCKVAGGPS